MLVNLDLLEKISSSSELSFNKSAFWPFFQVMSLYNAFIIFLLYVEVALKLIDNSAAYLRDGWAMVDLFITCLVSLFLHAPTPIKSTIPELADLQGSNEYLKVLRLLRTFKLVIRSPTMRVIILTILQAFKVI